ncbi:MAG: hypothetical protein IPM82_12200 [Saprospiraceae bacterium]|nr:hypothetical protein [Saprospiraceae bacterium]
MGWFGIISTSKYDKNWEPQNFGGNFFDGSFGEKTSDGGYILYDKLGSGINKNDSLGSEIWGIWDDSISILDVATDTFLNTSAATEQGVWVVDSIGQPDTLLTDFDFTHVESISFGNLVGAKSIRFIFLIPILKLFKKHRFLGRWLKTWNQWKEKWQC